MLCCSALKAAANCVPRPRVLRAELQPPGLPAALPTLGATRALRVCLFYDKPAARACCGGRWLCASNASYPLETCAMRQVGHEVVRKLKAHAALAARGVDVCEYNLEVDLAGGAPLPSFDVCAVLTHDWPTVHEDPAWAAEWMSVVTTARHAVPSKQQILWLFEKTRYVADIASAFAEAAVGGVGEKEDLVAGHGGEQAPIMLPTFILSADTDISKAAAWAQVTTPGKLVTKENFSAGKEGVTFVTFSSAAIAAQKLTKIRRNAGVVDATPKKTLRARGGGVAAKEAELVRAGHADGFDFVHKAFKGGNKNVLMVQQYERRFLTEPEKRLFYCRGEFLYAMGYRGWLDTNSTPAELAGEDVARELAQVGRLLHKLPRLTKYALVRFDFGPDALLSEIEVLPDMFGGPSGNLMGERWQVIVDKVAEAYVHQIVSGTAAGAAAAGAGAAANSISIIQVGAGKRIAREREN